MDEDKGQAKALAVFAVVVGKPIKRIALFSSLKKAVEWIDTQDDDCIIAPEYVDNPDCQVDIVGHSIN